MEDIVAVVSIVAVVVLILAAALLAPAVKIVPQWRVGIVERLGRYRRTIQPGLHLVAPVVDRVRAMVDTQRQRVTFGSLSCFTADRYPVAVRAELHYQVTDPVAATYEVADYQSGLEELTGTVLRMLVSELPLAQARAEYYRLNQQLRETVDERVLAWGIQVHHLEITALEPQ